MIDSQRTDETRRAATLKRHLRRTLPAARGTAETQAPAGPPGPTDVEWRPEPQAPTALEVRPPGVLDVLQNHRLAIGLGVAGMALLVAVVGLGVSLSSLLVLGMVLLCPLGHLLVMRGHGGEHGQQHAGGTCHGRSGQAEARTDAPPRG